MIRLLAIAFIVGFPCANFVKAEEQFAPKQDQIPVVPPEGAMVLFDGARVNQFLAGNGGQSNWSVEEAALISTPDGGHANHLVSRVHFRDADIHAEFMLPEKGPGNSGIYIHGNYELQIFNSFGKETPEQSDAGAVYGFHPPLVNACRKPGEWQVYDIRFPRPRRDAEGKITEDGSVTAWLNGQKVQDGGKLGEPRSPYHPYVYRTKPYLQTIWKEQKKTSVGPLFLQDHGNPVRFRNVWIRPLDDQAKVYEAQ